MFDVFWFLMQKMMEILKQLYFSYEWQEIIIIFVTNYNYVSVRSFLNEISYISRDELT